MKRVWWHAVLLAWLCCCCLPPAALGAARESEASSCIRCHAGLEKDLARPVRDWRESIHAANGISCQDCHGGDMTFETMEEAMDPGRGFVGAPAAEEVPDFCGKCHRGMAEDYLASAHGQALGRGGPQCVTCHGSHAMERPSPSLIDAEKCSRCHGFERAALIRDALLDTDGLIRELETGLQRLHRRGMAVKPLEEELFQARNTFHGLFHSVDVEKVRNNTASIREGLGEIGQKVAGMEQQLARRRWAGAVVVGLLALVTLLMFYVRHTYRR